MHTPFSVATGSILLVVDLNMLNIERKVIAKKFGVSEVTVIKTYRKIEQYKNILVNDDLTEKIALLIDEDKKKLQMPEKLKQMYNKITHETNDDLSNEDYISDDDSDDSDDSDDENITFKITDNNINDYIDSINIDLYESFGMTDEAYKNFIICI